MTTLTKDAIKKTFMKLLNQKQVNKITVKEIVEDCGINRNSFYYHFDDIPALIEEILNDQVDELVNRQFDADNIYDCVMYAMDFALQNKSAMLHIYNSANHDLFDRYLSRVAQRTVTEFFDKYTQSSDRVDPEDKNAIITYYKSLLIGFVVDWLSDGMKYDLTDKIKRMCELFEGTTDLALSRCKKLQK